jgi:hypothetical protein
MPSRAAPRRSSGTIIAPAADPVPFESPACGPRPLRPRAERVYFESLVIIFFLTHPTAPS